MSRISFMGIGGFDPIAQTKRVVWRPVSTGTALKVGDAVCYCKDAQDYKERTTNPITGGTTYAQGAQTYNGRLFIVEEPLIDNIDQFAGIVKDLGSKAGADGDFIEIYTANSGAVVPANIDTPTSTTVVGRTIMAVKAAQRTLDEPVCSADDFGRDTLDTTPTRSIGIAMEVRTTAGKCWVKLQESLFIYQGGLDAQELQVTGAGNLAVNKSFIDFKNTSGHSCALLYRTRLSGTGSGASKGVYRFDVLMDATTYGEAVHGLTVNVELACTARTSTLQTTPGAVYAINAYLRTQNMDPDLSGTLLSVLNLEMFLRKTTTGSLTASSTNAYMMRFNCDQGGDTPTAWFHAGNPEAVAFTPETTHTSPNKVGAIKVSITGSTANPGYIYVYSDTGA